MGVGSQTPRRKDAQGLSLDQRRLLSCLATGVEWGEAIRMERIPARRARDWVTTNLAFQAEYDSLFSGKERNDLVRQLMESLGPEAVRAHEDALFAEKGIALDVSCPKCHHEFTAGGLVVDHKTRLQAGRAVLGVGGHLKEIKKIEGEVAVAVLTFEETVALSLIRAGKTGVSPIMVTALRAKGVLPEGEEEVIDAEVKEITEG